jgi:phosphatidate cytidylyltransferase
VGELAVSRELRLRVISAAVLAPIALLLVWLGGLPLLLGLLLVSGLLAREWAGLVASPGGYPVLAALCGAALVAASTGFAVWAMVGLLVGGGALGVVVRGGAKIRILAALGPIYIGGACLAFMMLRAVPNIGAGLIVWLLVVVWSTDIGAYFAGRAIGGRKLAPTISPGKTWAGLGGGMIAAAIFGMGLASVTNMLPMLEAGVGAAVLAVASQLGDLFESWLKRRAGVKDAGDLIPGHGGLLDRVDGVMIATPLMAAAVLTLAG